MFYSSLFCLERCLSCIVCCGIALCESGKPANTIASSVESTVRLSMWRSFVQCDNANHA